MQLTMYSIKISTASDDRNVISIREGLFLYEARKIFAEMLRKYRKSGAKLSKVWSTNTKWVVEGSKKYSFPMYLVQDTLGSSFILRITSEKGYLTEEQIKSKLDKQPVDLFELEDQGVYVNFRAVTKDLSALILNSDVLYEPLGTFINRILRNYVFVPCLFEGIIFQQQDLHIFSTKLSTQDVLNILKDEELALDCNFILSKNNINYVGLVSTVFSKKSRLNLYEQLTALLEVQVYKYDEKYDLTGSKLQYSNFEYSL